MTGIKLGSNYKLTEDGRIVKDERAIERKLDVSTRLKRRGSKKQRVVKRRLIDASGTATDLDELSTFKRGQS